MELVMTRMVWIFRTENVILTVQIIKFVRRGHNDDGGSHKPEGQQGLLRIEPRQSFSGNAVTRKLLERVEKCVSDKERETGSVHDVIGD